MAEKGFCILKTLIVAYVITAGLLLITAFGLFRFNLPDWQITAAIVITYALSCFFGGYMLANAQKSKRMLWGMGFGILYFAVLAAVSFVLGNGTQTDFMAMIKSIVICLLAGGAGAFVTPE